ncbi:MAG: hypothetical protein R5N74_07070 [Cutibacterium granulosum]|nr:hypothetical protein [Cutibacterium granulosum]MDU1523685.1 hypothetical protein [Cutibacterium granulosum]MDU3768610.1 hypothetical protein [Cutibacterium granulosum]MEA5635380.1 hypothetical protein [Cutibacterium granulosum]MEA5639736.1 hypothetical protein [Cutibacterium granulosum]MEA5641950.1 hypothetical protein [Cutibacterium granulosum]
MTATAERILIDTLGLGSSRQSCRARNLLSASFEDLLGHVMAGRRSS